MPRSAQHSCKDAEHYTPAKYVEAARKVLGGIDLDPASCETANETVCAARFYDIVENGLGKRPWGGRVFCNPPGDPRGVRVKSFWMRACEYALTGGPDAVVLWAGYSLEQLVALQNCKDIRIGPRPKRVSLERETGTVSWPCFSLDKEISTLPCPTPMDWPRVILSKRIKWIRGKLEIQMGFAGLGIDDEIVCKNASPPHGNYFCLLGGTSTQRARFRRIFGQFGHYAPGTRRSIAQAA